MNEQVHKRHAGQGGSATEMEAAPVNLVALAYRALRGRFLITLILTAALALAGAWAGYSFRNPSYTSTGIIRVSPTLPKIMYSSEQNQLMPRFDSYVSSQATFLASHPVLKRSVDDLSQRNIDWPGGSDGIKALAQSLNVKHDPGSELIKVNVKHRDPAVAQSAVNAVISAYERTYGVDNTEFESIAERTLANRERELRSRIELLRQNVLQASGEYGPEPLEQFHLAAIGELEQIDKKLSELNWMIPAKRDNPTVTFTTGANLARILIDDKALEEYVASKVIIENEIASLRLKEGVSTPKKTELLNDLAAVEANIKRRSNQITELGEFLDLEEESATHGEQKSLHELEAMQKRLVVRRKVVSANAIGLGQKRMAVASFNEQISDVKQLLVETKQRLDQIRVESHNEVKGRVSVAAHGNLPVFASDDKRIQFAVVVGLMGACLGIGMVILYGLLRGRVRYSDELEDFGHDTRLMGVLPRLPRKDVGESQATAYAVDRLRNLLEMDIARADSGNEVVALTNTGSDSQANIVLALGNSFAHANYRTVLVDANFWGRDLSRSLGLEHESGLQEAIVSENIEDSLHPTDSDNLWMLPAGIFNPKRERHLSYADIRTLLDKLRIAFDLILIDAGTVKYSLEAQLASSVADQVLLTVPLGTPSAEVEQSLDQLKELGTKKIGFLFNKNRRLTPLNAERAA